MPTLSFATTPRVVSEPGACRQLGPLLKDLGVTRVMILTDAGIHNLGLTQEGIDSATAAGLQVELFTDVKEDPPEGVVLAAIDQARSAGVDGVVGLGGGSSMDIAKLVALLKDSEQKLQDIYGIGLATGHRLPLIQVPTTAGTGSEVTDIAIVTTPTDEKKGIVAPQTLPDIALLDANLTLGLPRHVTAATGIDAMVHAIEAFTSKHKKNPISDALARQALKLLSQNIRTACDEPGNCDAREAMLLGAMLAGMAFANAPVAAVHALAYPIGALFHVPHGLSNALMLPHVLKFNAPVTESLYAELARDVRPGQSWASEADATAAFVEELDAIIAHVGIETQLRDVGISHNHLPKLAEDAMNIQRLLVNNPREVTHDDALMLYQQAL